MSILSKKNCSYSQLSLLTKSQSAADGKQIETLNREINKRNGIITNYGQAESRNFEQIRHKPQ